MKTISLTRGSVALVDDADYEQLSRYKWYMQANGYAVRRGRSSQGESRKMVLMHRQIMCPGDDVYIDHINSNTLDNRRCNLRLATPQQNIAWGNNCHGLSKYRGVSKCSTTGRWRANIGYNMKQVWLGRYDSEEDAAKAYNRAALKFFGEFARLNEV